MRYEHLEDFVRCYNPEDRLERTETERFRAFSYDELVAREKASLDIFWLRDESLEDTENLPPPEVIAHGDRGGPRGGADAVRGDRDESCRACKSCVTAGSGEGDPPGVELTWCFRPLRPSLGPGESSAYSSPKNSASTLGTT